MRTAAAMSFARAPYSPPEENGEDASRPSGTAAHAPCYRIPVHYPGQRIGLFGGSFDPPHQAHLGASLLAMKRLTLDRVWWLVTPGNPLKNTNGLPPLNERVAAAQALAKDPCIEVTGIEAEIGVRYSFDTVRHLVSRCRGVHFVWIMGADNLRQFHLWRPWREVAALVPIVVVDRPGSTLKAISSPAGAALAPWRVPERDAARFAATRPPALIFLHGPRSWLSSTALRGDGAGENGVAAPALSDQDAG
jgi:nicotinate-nucleotide adenylyltransferase